MLRNIIIKAAAVVVTYATTCSAAACSSCKTISVDVAVLGGGAAGSYVAAQLTDVYEKNVVVVDTASRLGGHVDTAKFPGTDKTLEFGVLSYHNLSFVEPFFNRYGINLVAASGTPFNTTYLDQKTALPVNVTQYPVEEQMAALTRWTDFGLKYKKYVYPSYNLPSPLGDAAPLARPFVETVKELRLESIVVMLLDAHWSNDLLALPTLQAMSTFGYPWFDGTPMAIPESHNNTQLYANIQTHLGDKVLLNSRVTSVHRAANGTATITVKSAGGCTKIKAKQVVVGFVPTPSNMAPFDTTNEEAELFVKWNCVNLHNGFLRVDGLPDGIDFDPVSSDPERFFIPTAPNVRFLGLSGTPYAVTYVIGNPGTDEAGAKRLVEERLKTINAAGTFHPSTTPEYVAFSDHTPLLCSVNEAEMEAGFWTRVRALQGKRNTYYVGQAMAADLTAFVWAQANEVIESLVSS